MNADANKGGKRPGIIFQLAKNQFHKSVIMLPNINVRLRVCAIAGLIAAILKQ